MCGIFGILHYENHVTPDQVLLKETGRLLDHRGPDNCGIFARPGIGLVHTRLSLLDLSPRSNQPFWDKSGRYALVYNGEIYNFKELRGELESQGIQFRTTSDTEVLLEWLLAHPKGKALERLEGMFAFALYDKLEESLFLGRDRFGIKPLFIYDGNDRFIFASEIKAMQPWIAFEPDLLSISSFLFGFGGPTKGHSFFRDIKILAPGSSVEVVKGEKTRYSTFFNLNEFWSQDQASEYLEADDEKLVDTLEETLLASVKQQLVADAPVGTLCSGGLDSSLVTAMAAKLHNNIGIFHANVIGPNSEYQEARLLANYLKLDLNAVEVRPYDFFDYFPEVMEHFGHPFLLMPSSAPFLQVSKLVREKGCKAVLSGEGADESFLGYDFLMPNRLSWVEPMRKMLKRLVKRLLLGRGSSWLSEAEFGRFVMGFSPYSGLTASAENGLAELVMGMHNRFEVALETEELRTVLRGNESYMNSLDLLKYNLRAILHRNDSLGMAASIEARFPFLDSNVVRLGVNLPYRCKIKKVRGLAKFSGNQAYKNKWLLRKVAERYLPPELSRIEKRSFNLGHSHGMLQLPSKFYKDSCIREIYDLSEGEIEYLINKAPERFKRRMMHLEIWCKICLHGASTRSVSESLAKYTDVGKAESYN